MQPLTIFFIILAILALWAGFYTLGRAFLRPPKERRHVGPERRSAIPRRRPLP